MGNAEQGRDESKPLVALGDFWEPVVERVSEVEDGGRRHMTPHTATPIRFAASPREAAEYLAAHFCESALPASRPVAKRPSVRNEQAPVFGRVSVADFESTSGYNSVSRYSCRAPPKNFSNSTS